MKNKFTILLLAICAACSTKEHHNEAREWKEFDSFHKVMAEAFHPVKDSGNVEPAKKLAAQLADEADRWASASLPEKVNNDEMKAKLQQLKADARSLADDVAKGADNDAVKSKITSLHDQFHKIMEAWNKKGHHKEGEEDEDEDEDEEHEHDHDKDGDDD